MQPSAKVESEFSPPGELLSDVAIIERIMNGDLASFELIMRRYNQRLFRVVRGLLADDNEAEGVVQEAYTRAYEHLSQFKGRAQFSTWLTKIAIYEALSRRRKLSRLELHDPTHPESVPMSLSSSTRDAVEQASNRELSELLASVVDELPPDLRVVFVMRMVEGIDTNETAACLDLTSANVRIRLHRARSLLREQIDAKIGKETRLLYQFDGPRCDRIVTTVLSRLLIPPGQHADV